MKKFATLKALLFGEGTPEGWQPPPFQDSIAAKLFSVTVRPALPALSRRTG
jgi:hypothetical protein